MTRVEMRRRRGRGNGRTLLALALIAAMVVAGTMGSGALIGALWPLFILGPGLALFYVVRRAGRDVSLLTVPAASVTMLGLLLLFQNLTGHWSSWAYAWTLLFPTSLGLGLAFYGDLSRRERVGAFGAGIARVGLWMFALGFLFFEIVLGLGGVLGWLLGGFGIPLLLGAGLVYVVARRRRARRARDRIGRARPARALDERVDLDDLLSSRPGARARRR